MDSSRMKRLTLEGKRRIEEELYHLRNVRRLQVAERLHQAMEFAGDPVDNAEYQDAKEEQARVEGRIIELENILAQAIVVTVEPSAEGVVQLGATVTVSDDEGIEDTFVLVGSAEADPLEGRISIDSPVGRALLGHRVGDVVAVAAPARVIHYTIRDCRCAQ